MCRTIYRLGGRGRRRTSKPAMASPGRDGRTGMRSWKCRFVEERTFPGLPLPAFFIGIDCTTQYDSMTLKKERRLVFAFEVVPSEKWLPWQARGISIALRLFSNCRCGGTGHGIRQERASQYQSVGQTAVQTNDHPYGAFATYGK